jgi:serine/threonine-protein kinase
MGEVREAWDVVLCRSVALKVLRRMDPVSLLRFMREAKAQSRVAHPNICQIYDVDSSEGAPRIAMQLVRGPTLADAAGTLAPAQVAEILAQVADAVHAAHRLRLIHRDLKPSNILLERSADGTWFPYVCDFGLAIALGEATLTAGQQVNGTPAYMAPEQVQGDRTRIGPATDVFALGGTLYFALHGHPPKGAPAEGESPAEAGADPAARPVPRDLDRIIGKCLDPDPELRYRSAAALAEDLRHFLRGSPVHAGPTGFIGQIWRCWRKTWKVALPGALAAGSLLAGLELEHRHRTLELQRRAEWARTYGSEAAEMEQELRQEMMLPAHDLRPAYARLRTRLETIRALLPAQGKDAQGPGRYTLGLGLFLLGNFAGARMEFEQARAAGFQGPEVELPARAMAGVLAQADQESRFVTGRALPPSARALPVAEAETLFRQQRPPAFEPDEYVLALLAFMRQDYAQAAVHARAAIPAQPWPSAVLECACLTALGQEAFDAGDFILAEARYGQAMDVARRFAQADQSDERIHHAYLLAARRLATLRLERGEPSLPFLSSLQTFAAQARQLNPDNPDLQDDWLGLAVLKAMALAERDRDPVPELDSALAFFTAQVREPFTVELRADRMLIHWQLAEWAFRRGLDPDPSLARALEDPGHTPFLGRDYLGDILNFKARVEASRGRDPRPVLDQALARMRPLLGPAAPRTLRRTAARSWLIRAEWEAAHGLDSRPSLQQARALEDRLRMPVPDRRP